MQRRCFAGLPLDSHLTALCGLSRLGRGGLIRSWRESAEYRHDNQPAVGKLIVAHHRITVVQFDPLAEKTLEHVAGRHGAVQNFAGSVESLPFLREHCHSSVHDLHDVIGANRERAIGWVDKPRRPLWSFKAFSQTVEAGNRFRRWFRTGLCLFDGDRLWWNRDGRGRAGSWLACGALRSDNILGHICVSLSIIFLFLLGRFCV